MNPTKKEAMIMLLKFVKELEKDKTIDHKASTFIIGCAEAIDGYGDKKKRGA